MASDFAIDPDDLEEGPELARGGFGSVLEGRLKEGSGHRRVAIKLLPIDSNTTARERLLFTKEVIKTIELSKMCSRLVECYGYSVRSNGQTCLIMKLYEGSTLHALLGNLVEDEKLPNKRIAQIALDIATAVKELHYLRHLVEDIKPANVLLGADGHAVLADLGMARSIATQFSAVTDTETGGTVVYMPPEKLEPNDDQFHFGFASDVWSLGITLLQLALSDIFAPFGCGMSKQNVRRELRDGPPHVPDMPELPGLHHLIQRCLQLDPRARISIDDLVQGLTEVNNRACSSSGQDATAYAALEAKLQQADKEVAKLQRQLAEADARHAKELEDRLKLEEERPSAESQVIRLSTGGLSSLRDALASRACPTIDLCGHTCGDDGSNEDLVPPSCSKIKNGTLMLPGKSCVRIIADRVRFEGLTIIGMDTQEAVVQLPLGSLEMEDCCVEGTGHEESDFWAVRVTSNSRFLATNSTLRCIKGCGLVVRGGSKAVLEHSTINNCKYHGISVVGKGSMLHAEQCNVDGNGSGIRVTAGAHAYLLHTSCNNSRGGWAAGWAVDQGSTLTAIMSEASRSGGSGASAGTGGSLTLVQCCCDDNGENGWRCGNSGSSIVAKDSSARGNRRGDVHEYSDGRIVCLKAK